MSGKANREETIFEQALGMDSPEGRQAYLREACGEDAALLERLQGLLRAHDRAGRFLEHRESKPGAASSRRSDEADSLNPPQGPPPHVGGYETKVAPAENPGERIGRYKLLEKIGEGGFGDVWMAEQEEPVRRRVALKIIKLGMDTRSVIARFEAERQALALMDHPNIARVFDGGATENGRPYFVMELVRGLPITQYCDETKMATRERLELFGQVCRAVQHAHQKGIIHRDLKPSNILVTEQDGRPMPKVIDFGVAKATEGRLTDKTLFTGFQQLIGTPTYMSPEQAGLGGLDIDTRSDTYSLGVVLYELLTGRPPFDTKELLKSGYEAVLRTIREVDPPKPSTRLTELVAADVRRLTSKSETGNAKSEAERASLRQLRQEKKELIHLLRGDLDWIVMKCLEKDRSRRYNTANGLAADIERYLKDEPVAAGPPTARYRLKKLVRKHRVAVAVVAGFGLLLTTATVVSALLALWANRERTRAEAAQTEAQAVLDFFQQKVLAAARPEGLEGGLGYDVTLRSAVDAAEPEIAKSFAERPRVEASIRNVLGTTYYYLGEYPQAIQEQERTLELRRREFGPEDPRTLTAMSDLASAFRAAGRFAEAVQLSEETLKLRTSRLGLEHRDTLASMHDLGWAYASAGRIPEAVRVYEQALKLRKAKLGPDHLDTLQSMNSLGWTYRQAGRYDEAVQISEETLKLRQAKLGLDHADTLASMHVLAIAYLYMPDRSDDAVRLCEETIRLRRAKLGPDHPGTLHAMMNLAQVFMNAPGRAEESLSIFKNTLELSKTKLGPNHPTTLMVMGSLALAYQRAGRQGEGALLYEDILRTPNVGVNYLDQPEIAVGLARAYHASGRTAEALPLFERALKEYKANPPPDPYGTLSTMSDLASVYQGVGRTSEAIQLLEEVVKRAKAIIRQPSEPYAIWHMIKLADAYRGHGRRAEALALLDEGRHRCNVGLPADHHLRSSVMRSLAAAYQALERSADALAVFEESLKLRKAKLGPDHPDTLKSMEDLAAAYRGDGRATEAVTLQEESLRLRKAKIKSGPNHRDSIGTMIDLAKAYDGSGRTAEALALFEEAYKACQANLAPDDDETLRAMKELALAYQTAGRSAEAVPLFEERLKLRKAKLGPDHKDTVSSTIDLAAAYRQAGRMPEALPLLEKVVKGFQANEVRNDQANACAMAMRDLAFAHQAVGRPTDAIPLLEQALELSKAKKLALGNSFLIWRMIDLARAYDGTGRRAEAVTLFEEALQASKANLAPDDDQTLHAMKGLALAYQTAGRSAEAIPLFEERLKLRKAKLGPDHQDTLSSMDDLATAYQKVGRTVEALSLYEEALKGCKAKLPPDHPQTLRVMKALGVAYQAAGRSAEAETLLREAKALIERQPAASKD